MPRKSPAASKRQTKPVRRKTRGRPKNTKLSGASVKPERKTTLAVESVDITPTPKILKVLGNIEFHPWQCVAELVDNCFDEFLDIKRSNGAWTEPFGVKVSFPTTVDGPAIFVRDNGRGMSLEDVTDAARAGWTSNDPVSKLGLFGMGFNVATARLGNVTRLLTTRSGDAEWVGIEINLETMIQDFKAPVIRRPKSSKDTHGTRVEILELEPRANWLQRSGNLKKLRETLGGIYSYLLDTQGFRLSIEDVEVKPVRHCVWDESRSVTRGKEVIPAIIPIDQPLADRAVCHACGTWQDFDNSTCDSCSSNKLEVRERRVWGWLGIQRFLDPKEFGIDFLRNGRKILRFDKTLFQWRDPDDPSGQGDVEYPIELAHQGGRIVGEIHVDHVPVNYLKNNFDTNDKGWRNAVEILRGRSPLLPQRAKELGYEPNDSPLARLHRGYRRNDPGRKYLTPGNGKVMIDTKEMVKKFRQGASEFQNDSKWWELVVRHDELHEQERLAKEERDRRADEGVADPTEEFRAPTEDEQAVPSDEGGAPQTERQRIDSLLEVARPMPELEGEFTASGVAGQPVKMTAYQTTAAKVTTAEGRRTPVWLASRPRGAFAAFVDLTHPHFKSFDDDPADLVLMELAQHLIARAPGAALPISAVFAGLKERYLASRTIEMSRLVALATQLLRDLQQRMTGCVINNPERPWLNALNEAERHLTADRIIEVLKVADYNQAISNGTYLRYVPPSVVPRIVEEWPEAFFDNKLFRLPFEEVESPSARRHTVATVAGYLYDAAWLASTPPSGSREQLIRARLSLQLLPEEIVPEEE